MTTGKPSRSPPSCRASVRPSGVAIVGTARELTHHVWDTPRSGEPTRMQSLPELFRDAGLPDAAAKALVVIGLFAAAGAVARGARLLARGVESRAAAASVDWPLTALAG